MHARYETGESEVIVRAVAQLDEYFAGRRTTFDIPLLLVGTDFQKTVLKKGASIGANSTVLGGIVVGENSLIGAGSVVTKDVPANELWVGNPAKKIRNI